MGKIIKVSGPLVVADGMADANMADVVRVGEQRLIGEVLNGVLGDLAVLQQGHVGAHLPDLVEVMRGHQDGLALKPFDDA